MDWSEIENDVHNRTQQALVAVSEYKSGREEINRNSNQSRFYDKRAASQEEIMDYEPRQRKRAPIAIAGDLSSLENYVQDLRNVTMLQGKKVLSMENILSSYSGVFESSTEAQSSLIMRLDEIEHNLRGNNKFVIDASKERSAMTIHVRNLTGKVNSLEDSLQSSERSYATKEAFSQLLDNTVDEVKSVGVAVSQATVKSTQSLSLIEALIMAIHRMRGRLDAFALDEPDAAYSLSAEFLSSLTGERQRDQVVRLLRESLLNSVSSVAKDVVSREAESICSSVNGMLKTLNAQLMHSVGEVGKQTKAMCTAANNKANQCLAATSHLENRQTDIIQSIDAHAEHTQRHVAKQLSDAIESLGEVLEDIASIQKTVKGDLKSFGSELADQRKTLYLEMGLLKEGNISLRNNCSSLERAHNADCSVLDKRVGDLDAEVRSIKARMKVESEESVGSSTAADLSKEVITALVTEVILADTIDRRGRDLAEVAEVISSRQRDLLTSMGEEAESRVTVQLQTVKGEFKIVMEAMAKKIDKREAEIEELKKKGGADAEEWRSKMESKMEEFQKASAKQMEELKKKGGADAEEWRSKMESKMEEFQKASAKQAMEHASVVQQLRSDLEKKSKELAVALKNVSDKNESALLSSVAALTEARASEKQEAEPVAAALLQLQKDVVKVSGKVGEAHTALAKMNVQSMHLQDEMAANSSSAKESRTMLTELAAQVEKMEKLSSAPPAVVIPTPQQVSSEQFKQLEDRIDAAIKSVAASVSAAKKEGDTSTENRVQTVAAQHTKLTSEVDALRVVLQRAEKDHGTAISQTSSSLKRIEIALSAVEDGLDVLHGEVDQQAEQSSLLQKKILLTEERVVKMETAAARPAVVGAPLYTEPMPARTAVAASYNAPDKKAADPAPPSGPTASSYKVQPENMSAAMAKSVLTPTPVHVQVPASIVASSAASSIPSYGSSMTNSPNSTRCPSTPAIEELQMTGSTTSPVASVRSGMMINTDDSDDQSSFDGSDLAMSPFKAFTKSPSSSGAAGARRFMDAMASPREEEKPVLKPVGVLAQVTVSPKAAVLLPKLGDVEGLSKALEVDSGEQSDCDVFSAREEVMKQIAGVASRRLSMETDREKGLASPSSHLSLGVAGNLKKPMVAAIPSRAISNQDHEEDVSSSDDDDDDDNFSEDNSISGSEGTGPYKGPIRPKNAASAHALMRGQADDSADLSSSLDTSISPLRPVAGHSLAHFDPHDPTGMAGGSPLGSPVDRRSGLAPLTTLAPLNPSGRTLSPYTPGIASPTSKSGPQSSSLYPSSLASAATSKSSMGGPMALAPGVPTIRSPQPVLSGSLLSTARKPVIVTATAPPTSTSLAPSHLPMGGGMKGYDSSATAGGRGHGPKEEEDDDGNLDFDTSSWDEDDEAEESS